MSIPLRLPTYIEFPIPDWKVIAEVETTADVDYVDFTGLDINRDKFYILFATIGNPPNPLTFYYFFVEGDYTLTNYYSQELYVWGNSVSGYSENSPLTLTLAGLDRTLFYTVITRDPLGFFRYYSSVSSRQDASLIIEIYAGVKTSSVDNITSIRFAANRAGGIGAGSKFLLCRPRS